MGTLKIQKRHKIWPKYLSTPSSSRAIKRAYPIVKNFSYSLFSNGYSRCGIFIAANVCIDQMDMDHEVDVFHAVKMIRINRPQLIDMKVRTRKCYGRLLRKKA